MSSTDPEQTKTEQHPVHLDPSELGTKEYWESYYERSLNCLSSKRRRGVGGVDKHNGNAEEGLDDNDDDNDSDEEDADDDDDPGTSWFSEHNAPQKVLQFLTSPSFPLAPCNTLESTTATGAQQPDILDLGTGNGSMLVSLREEGGWMGKMVGVDYSERSVELARVLAGERFQDGNADGDLRFEVWDVFEGKDTVEKQDWFPSEKGGFDVVLDKGTFDAVSLCGEEVGGDGDGDGDGEVIDGKRVRRRVCEMYPGIVRRLVRRGGFVVVTSCNWTEEELIRWFTSDADGDGNDGLEVWERIEYPKFRFGGMEGQGVCTVCFQRRAGK